MIKPIEKLDLTLMWFSPKNPFNKFCSFDDVYNGLLEKYPELSKEHDFISELNIILDKLIDDKNIKTQDRKLKIAGTDEYKVEVWYQITYNGWILSQTGCYTTQDKNLMSKNKLDVVKYTLLIIGSYLAGIGAISLVYFEYVKLNHHDPYGIKLWQILLGIFAIIIVITVCSLINKKQN